MYSKYGITVVYLRLLRLLSFSLIRTIKLRQSNKWMVSSIDGAEAPQGFQILGDRTNVQFFMMCFVVLTLQTQSFHVS